MKMKMKNYQFFVVENLYMVLKRMYFVVDVIIVDVLIIDVLIVDVVIDPFRSISFCRAKTSGCEKFINEFDVRRRKNPPPERTPPARR